jgi:hypothetical protein
MGAMLTSLAANEQGLTLVHFSAQPEPIVTQKYPMIIPNTYLINPP